MEKRLVVVGAVVAALFVAAGRAAAAGRLVITRMSQIRPSVIIRRITVEQRIIILAFVGGFVVAAILVAAGLIFPSKRPDVWPEIVKAGLELGVVTVLGAGITFALACAQSTRDEKRRKIEREAEEERRKAEYRLGVFRDVVAAYNGVKSVRRVRSGLSSHPIVSHPIFRPP